MLRTCPQNRRSSRGQMVVRLLVFAAALAGLFAMHGLSDHGAASHDMNAPMVSAATAMAHTGQMADHSREATDDAPGDDSPGMAMAGLCLAVLAGAIVGFLLLRPHRNVVFLRPIVRSVVPARRSGRRDRDPPCLFQLSVLRT